MNSQLGPWATQIDVTGNLRLNAFWRRRMTRLAALSRGNPVKQGRRWPAAALTLLAPAAIWLASPAAVPSADSKTPAGKGRCYVASYYVGDLVTHVASDRQPARAALGKARPAVAGPDFQALADLITSAVAPESWKAAGGQGRIAPLHNHLTLAISQTPEVHEEIVDLLEQLRRLRGVHIVVETKVVTLKGTSP